MITNKGHENAEAKEVIDHASLIKLHTVSVSCLCVGYSGPYRQAGVSK